MNYLIIITGMPGSGKTSIANYLNENLNSSTFISVDQLKENIYDLIGFHCRDEKTSIRKLTYNVFEMLLNECMLRNDKYIITEYAFDDNWYSLFFELTKKYHYETITIKVSYDNLLSNYQKMVDRDRYSGRHVAQCLKEYNPLYKNNYVSKEKWTYDYFQKFYKSFNMLNIGQIIEIQNSEHKNIKNLLQETLTYVKKIIM